MEYIEMIDRNNVPQHIAIIMDGNGRWAKQRGLDRSEGHQAGAATVRKLVENALKLGVRYLTLYTFSTENWKRPQAEVAALMVLLFESIEEEIFMKNNVAFRVVGDIEKLPANVLERLRACEERPSVNDAMTMVLIARRALEGEITLESIDDKMIDGAMATSFMPDPDLLIRTGKEQRLSNFLLWQCAYSEFYFTDVLWPDFDNNELCKAVYDYQQRQRRYGKTGEQVEGENK